MVHDKEDGRQKRRHTEPDGPLCKQVAAQHSQGGTAEDVQYAFQENGWGAVVNSSRGIICAWQKTGKNGADYQEAARAAAIAMRDDICRFIAIQ